MEFPALLGIFVAISIGAASPGPSFIVVARTSVVSRTGGLASALGMGIGGVVFAVAALLGLHGLLLAVPSLYWAFKVAGGLYLAYLGVRIWLAAAQPLAIDGNHANSGNRGVLRALVLGCTTQLSNPKTAIVYAGVFAAFLPASPTLAFDVAVVAVVFCIEAGWYGLVALVLSSERPRLAYLRCKAWIDRAAGGVMGTLGLRLALSAQR
jgi:threonine/homoserine/homoserine lactone efflux protein